VGERVEKTKEKKHFLIVENLRIRNGTVQQGQVTKKADEKQ
jgi:hypothetical protein